jgi:uncharacterized membrane protein YhfC
MDYKLTRKRVIWFFLGAACFIISQSLTRLPILQQMQQSTDFILVYSLYPLLIGILIALSAGVFEEGARFLFKQFLIKPAASDFSQPLIFGLGHGIAEAFLVLIPALSLVSVPELGLAFFERILTIILHVTLTVVVWNGFQKNRRVLYLLIAILIHGLVDSLIPILSPLPNAIFLLEGALVVVDIIMVGYAWYSRKYYTGRNSNEKIGV